MVSLVHLDVIRLETAVLTFEIGYDELFGYYVTYMKKLAPEVAEGAFMFNDSATGDYDAFPALGPGLHFFDCTGGVNGQHIYNCSEMASYESEVRQYPTALTLRDADGYTAALANTGLDPSWIDFGDYEKDITVVLINGDANTYKYKFTGFPVQNTSMVSSSFQEQRTRVYNFYA